jgi:hypothetical protein
MPFFNSSSRLQINGGHFYDIAGELNVQSTQLAMPDSDSRQVVYFDDRRLSGPERNLRPTGAARVGPYRKFNGRLEYAGSTMC